jgi:hypothetical protein
MSDNDEVCLKPNCAQEVSEKDLPSTLSMMKNLLKDGKTIIDGVLANEGMLVTEEVREDRLMTCGSCEFFILSSKRCVKCGCFMETKSMFKKTSCPVGKW